jgi:arabinofuranosyltransferase
MTLAFFIFLSFLAALFIYWLGYEKPTYGIDDANIYFVYMRHLATGHGFVWNIGGEKVEGFTSLLWTLLGAGFYRLTGDAFPWCLLTVNFLLTYIATYRLLLLLRKCNGTAGKSLTPTDIVFIALLLLPLGFLEWNILSLMETGLWFFLIANLSVNLCDFYLTGKPPNRFLFGLLISTMILTRPESIAFCPVFILLLFIHQAADQGYRKAFASTWFPFAAYAITLLVLLRWRMAYFGYPFPNTYYAKVSASEKDNFIRGLSYLHMLFYNYPQVALTSAIGGVFACVLLAQWHRKKAWLLSTNDKIILTLLAVMTTGLALPVLTGGDHFKLSRFYQCIIPVSYVIALNQTFWRQHLANFAVSGRSSKWLLAAALTFSIFFVAKSTWYDFIPIDKVSSGRILPEFYHARTGRTIAEKMDTTFAPCARYPSVGVLAAGGFTYDYLGSSVDLMGLNNTLMAHATRIKQGFRNHASFDVNTFWKLEPDVVGDFYGGQVVTDTGSFILPENTDYFRNGQFVYMAYKQIFDYSRFIQTYIPALVRNSACNYYIYAYYNRSFLKTLDPQHFQIIRLERKLAPKPVRSQAP